MFSKKLKVLYTTVLAFIASIFIFSAIYVSADGLFESNDKITFTSGYKSELVEDNRSGLLISSSGSENSYTFNQNMSGTFEVETRILSREAGTPDFSLLSFLIRDRNSDLGLVLSLFLDEGQTKFELTLTLPEKCFGRDISEPIDSSFDMSGNIARFGFDTDTFEVFYYQDNAKKILIDLDNPEDVFKLNTTVLYSGFEHYNVEIQMKGAEIGVESKVILYSINGQNLDGETYTNNIGPSICGQPVLSNGVVNKEYVFKNDFVETFDVIDGYKKEFKGFIEVLSPSGESTVIDNLSFIPSEAGEYELKLTPSDNGDISGKTYKYTFSVLDSEPETEISLSFPIEDVKIGKDEVVYFPSATSSSAITKNNGEPVMKLVVKQGEKILAELDPCVVNSYKFSQVGQYQVAYIAENIFGTIKEISRTIVVDDSSKTFIYSDEFNASYGLDEVVKIPSAFVNGKKTDSVVGYPDGRSTSSEFVVLDTTGLFNVKYYADNEEVRTRYFNVGIKNSSLWSNVRGVNVLGNKDAPYYSAENYNGVMLGAYKADSVARFSNVINLADNTKNDILLDFFLAPAIHESPEFYSFDIVLTDLYDSENKVTIHFTKDDWADRYIIYQNACANKAGIYSEQKTIRGSFFGMYNSRVYGWYPAISLKIHFDYANKTIYSSIPCYPTYKMLSRKMVDLSDESEVGKGNAWNGFTTGECIMSVVFKEVNIAPANVLILNVDGQTMSGEYANDFTEPYIFVDYDGNDENELPLGVVNEFYPYFNAEVKDLLCGQCSQPEIQVYYKHGDNLKKYFESSENGFVPDKAGNYVVRYVGRDYSGNTTYKDVDIVVKDRLDQLNYKFNNIKENYNTGDEIYVLDGQATGGSGILSNKITVTYNGTEIQLDKGMFIPEKSGKYVVTCEISDYLGFEKTFTHIINVSANVLPILVEGKVPEAIILGQSYVFDNWSAIDFGSDKKINLPVDITVDGVKLNDDKKWTPETTGKHSVVFSATNGNGTIESEIYSINVVSVEENPVYLANYFNYDGVSVTGENDCLVMTANKDNAKFGFINSIYADFSIRFKVPEEMNNFDGVKIFLSDSKNIGQVIELTILKNSEGNRENIKSEIIINGETKEINGTFYNLNNVPFEINYNNADLILSDYKGMQIYTFDNLNGKEWNGFDSNKIYIDFQFIGVTGNSAIQFSRINNQSFSGTAKRDNIEPQVFCDVTNNVEFGQTLVTKPAECYDVLGDVVQFTLSVVSPSDKYILKDVDPTKEYEIKMEEYGEYYFKFFAKDSNGKVNRRQTFVVNVYDRVPPVLNFKGEVPSSGSVGKKINLPEVSATDNCSENITVYVMLVRHDGYTVRLKENSFVAESSGKYRVVYFASDDYGSSEVKSFEIVIG